jgi:hypothetical protein
MLASPLRPWPSAPHRDAYSISPATGGCGRKMFGVCSDPGFRLVRYGITLSIMIVHIRLKATPDR